MDELSQSVYLKRTQKVYKFKFETSDCRRNRLLQVFYLKATNRHINGRGASEKILPESELKIEEF